MEKKKTSMWLTKEAFVILDKFSKEMGIPKTSVMELALRELNQTQEGLSSTLSTPYQETKIRELVIKTIKEYSK